MFRTFRHSFYARTIGRGSWRRRSRRTVIFFFLLLFSYQPSLVKRECLHHLLFVCSLRVSASRLRRTITRYWTREGWESGLGRGRLVSRFEMFFQGSVTPRVLHAIGAARLLAADQPDKSRIPPLKGSNCSGYCVLADETKRNTN